MFSEDLFDVFGDEPKSENDKKKRPRPSLSGSSAEKSSVDIKKMRLDMVADDEEDEEMESKESTTVIEDECKMEEEQHE